MAKAREQQNNLNTINNNTLIILGYYKQYNIMMAIHRNNNEF